MRLVFGEEGKKTRHLIRKMSRLAPEAADTREAIAFYSIARGKWKNGIAVLLEFTDQHPLNVRGWHNYARWLYLTGNEKGASDAILKSNELYQNDPEILKSACEMLADTGRIDELKVLLERMLRRFPKLWSIWATAGETFIRAFNI